MGRFQTVRCSYHGHDFPGCPVLFFFIHISSESLECGGGVDVQGRWGWCRGGWKVDSQRFLVRRCSGEQKYNRQPQNFATSGVEVTREKSRQPQNSGRKNVFPRERMGTSTRQPSARFGGLRRRGSRGCKTLRSLTTNLELQGWCWRLETGLE